MKEKKELGTFFALYFRKSKFPFIIPKNVPNWFRRAFKFSVAFKSPPSLFSITRTREKSRFIKCIWRRLANFYFFFGFSRTMTRSSFFCNEKRTVFRVRSATNQSITRNLIIARDECMRAKIKKKTKDGKNQSIFSVDIIRDL